MQSTIADLEQKEDFIRRHIGPSEEEIATMLRDIGAASLDVLAQEPLPADSPFWTHPKVMLTPHNAADTDPDAISVYVAEQIAAFERGEALANVVDRRVGY